MYENEEGQKLRIRSRFRLENLVQTYIFVKEPLPGKKKKQFEASFIQNKGVGKKIEKCFKISNVC